jgi:hypothetical protein
MESAEGKKKTLFGAPTPSVISLSFYVDASVFHV